MKPNIIFILSDQHNPAVMGNGGDAYARTPNIDRLAEEGASFDNCYCAAPLCVPSRSSLLSGLMPHNTGVYNNMQSLRSDQATFVNALSVGGYETVLSGRMHFVGADQRHGFEKRFVGDITPSHIGADNEEEIYGEFKRSSGQNRVSIEKSGAGHSAVLDFDRDVANCACRYIKNRTDPRPLFLTVGFYGPHCPYIAPPELYEHYYRELPVPEVVPESYKTSLHPAIQSWYRQRGVGQVGREDVRRIRAAYYGMVTYMDNLVGEVADTVREYLDMDNTVIIYASDHGDNIGQHGLFWKTNFYEGASRVPLICSWKGKIPGGKRHGEVCSLVDLAPTLLRIGESPSLPKYDGVDLTGILLHGGQMPEERMVLSECSDIKGDNPSAMVRWKSYKLVVHAGYDAPQLFDLQKDPGEYHDRGTDGEYREIINFMREYLGKYWDAGTAMMQLEQAKRHVDLMTKWVQVTSPPLHEEWRGDREKNYLVGQR